MLFTDVVGPTALSQHIPFSPHLVRVHAETCRGEALIVGAAERLVMLSVGPLIQASSLLQT